MSAYNSSYTGQQIDNAVGAITNILSSGGFISAQGVNTILGDYLTTSSAASTYVAQSALLDLIYPVGAIYMSVNSTSPATLFGGTWEQIEDTFLLSAGSTYTAGNTGGEATHTLIESETPAHTHTRGTMNITGSQQFPNVYADNSWPKTSSGALSYTKASGYFDDGNNGSCNNLVLQLNAANNWTGATSSFGGDGAHNNMPPYLVVYVWKRTA